MVGDGIVRLCERAVGGEHPDLAKRLVELARAEYHRRMLRHTRPYAGISELLGTLRSRGVRLAVLSNKPHELTLRVVAAVLPPGEFVAL
jgi:phosphoglycolate phosphatase